METSLRGLQGVYRLDKELVPGRNTPKELVKNCCRKWGINQAEAWARMRKVHRIMSTYFYFWGGDDNVQFLTICLFNVSGIVNPIEAKVRKGKGAVGAYGNERTQQSLQDFPAADSDEEEEKVTS